MSGLWARLRGESRGRHEQLSSHDEDNEMEAAFAGPEDQEQAEPLGRRAPSVPGPTASDQPYDTPLADHPLSSDCHTLSSARSSDDLSSLGAPAYDFELNPSELRSAPSSASNAESNNFMTGRVVPQGRSGQVRQALQWGLASLGHFSRYGRIRSQDPDGQSAASVRGANDGVFANLSAKPEATSRTSNGNVDWVGGDDEGNNKEVPPVC